MNPVAMDVGASFQVERTTQPIAAKVAAPPAALPAAAVAIPQAHAQAQSTESEVRKAVEAANRALKEVTSDIEFAVDADSGRTVLKVVDATTQQVIRQFPSEEILAIARALDRYQGLLLKEKA